jgi:hypothetical protein
VITETHEDFLQEVIDGLTTAHTTALDIINDLRTEMQLMQPIVALAEVYLDARAGLCEDDPASIRTMMASRLLDYRQVFGAES